MTERIRAPGSGSTVSVEEHQALQASHTVLLNQFEAADEVLSAIGRSAADPDTVLTTIVQSARRLCRVDAAHLYLLERRRLPADQLDRALRASRSTYIAEHPMPVDRDTLIGRVGLDRTTQQIADVLADPDYGRLRPPAGRRLPHHHGRADARRRRSGRRHGRLAQRGRPFDEREMAIVTAFAGQAAMAVNGVKLVQELRGAAARSSPRRSSELEALREVGEAVSSSLDVDRVLSTIAMHAVELSDTDGGSIMEYDERDRCFMVRSVYRTEPEVVERLRSDPDRPRRDPGRARRA